MKGKDTLHYVRNTHWFDTHIVHTLHGLYSFHHHLFVCTLKDRVDNIYAHFTTSRVND